MTANKDESNIKKTTRYIFIGFGCWIAVCLGVLLANKPSSPTDQDNAPSNAPSSLVVARACRDLIRANAKHPSTVSIDNFLAGGSYKAQPMHGEATMVMPFKAKNSFGIEIEYEALCVVNVDGTSNIFVSEQ